jgi:8-oxo-dGTP pyrophosphatase MutT (NUDIX family)
MKMEKSAGFVIYRTVDNKPLYLLLKYPPTEKEPNYWGLPKGHIENEETPKETAFRELYEETGIKKEEIEVIPGFKEWNKYFFKHQKKTIFKMVIYFLAETKKETVKVSKEHVDSKWVTFEDAMKLMPFKDSKRIVKKANKFI